MAQVKHDAVTEKLLKEYEESNKPKPVTSKNVYDEKNYFSTSMNESENSVSKQIRVLPSFDGGSYIQTMHVHSYKLPKNKFASKFTCLKENFGKPCPFCEAQEQLFKKYKETGLESDKTLANSLRPRKTYVIRVIDRSDEGHGVKIWRFNDDFTKKGVYDKLMSLIKVKGNITDFNTGRDLTIDITRDTKRIPIISGIVDHDPSQALEDKARFDAIVSDPRTWENFYGSKDYDYLAILVMNGEPVWDKTTGKWVDKTIKEGTPEVPDYSDDEINIGGKEKTVEKPKPTAAPVVEEPIEDLPF